MSADTANASPQPVKLLLAPAACGKTTAALAALTAHTGKAALLAPAQQREQIEHRLVGHVDSGVNRSTPIWQFDQLAQTILKNAGQAQSLLPLDLVTRQRLLRQVLQNLAERGQLPLFGRVAQKPGFVATVSAFIYEAQHALVEPQMLATAGVGQYDTELSIIYQTYVNHSAGLGLVDLPQRLIRARQALQTFDADLLDGLSLLVVDSFDRFTLLELSLLQSVSARIERCVITLTGEATPRAAHHCFAATYQQLTATLNPSVELLPPRDVANETRQPLFVQLERQLFRLDAPDPAAPALAIDTSGALSLIQAADREREVRAVLRRVKRLLSTGVAATEILIVARMPQHYLSLLHEIAREYQLTLAPTVGQPLGNRPIVQALILLLRLPIDQFPPPALSEIWRSFADGRLPLPAALQQLCSSHGLQPDQIAGLFDRVAAQGHRTRSLTALQQSLSALAEVATVAAPLFERDDYQLSQPVTATQAGLLLAVVNAFVDWFTPLRQARFSDHITWLRERLPPLQGAEQLSLDLLESTSDADELSVLQKELTPSGNVWEAINNILDRLTQATELLREPIVTYTTFWRELTTLLRNSNYYDLPVPADAEQRETNIAVVSARAARGHHVDHLFLFGLSDGEFPPRPAAPPFYTRRERALLAGQNIPLLPSDPTDERSLFYELVAGTRRSLTLAHTYLDERGNTVPISPFVAALLQLIDPATIDIERSNAGSTPSLTDAVSLSEQLIALVAQGANTTPTDWPPGSKQLFAHVRRACTIELGREGIGPYGPFDGLIDDPVLQTELAQRFGQTHTWSVTQFHDYITCPFRFAAAHVLNLEPLGEPEEGLAQIGRGLVYHEILAQAGERWRSAGLMLTAAQEEPILAALEAAADEVLPQMAQRPDIVQGTFWEWEQADVRQRLARAIRRMLQAGNNWDDFRIAAVEQGFGLGSGPGTQSLILQTPSGPVQVKGRIDRLDQRGDGSLALIDYKSNSRPFSLKETLEGHNVQLTIYLLAAEQLIAPGQAVTQAAFFHLGSGKFSPLLTAEQRDTALDAMYKQVATVRAGVQQGDFAVRPRAACPTNCTFAHICRLNTRKRDAQT